MVIYNILSGIVCGLCMLSACCFCYDTMEHDYRASHTKYPICLKTYKTSEIVYKTICKHGFNEIACPFCQQYIEYI